MDVSFLCSSLYSVISNSYDTQSEQNRHPGEKRVSWMFCFVFWSGGIPPMRWIVNFDQDLLDGLVLAAQIAAYCPYLVRGFLIFCKFYAFYECQCVCSSLQCWGVHWVQAAGVWLWCELQVQLWVVGAGGRRPGSLTLFITKLLGTWGTARCPEGHSRSRWSRKSQIFTHSDWGCVRAQGFLCRGPSSEAPAPGYCTKIKLF